MHRNVRISLAGMLASLLVVAVSVWLGGGEARARVEVADSAHSGESGAAQEAPAGMPSMPITRFCSAFRSRLAYFFSISSMSSLMMSR